MHRLGIVLLLLAVGLAAPLAGQRSTAAQGKTCFDERATIVTRGPGTVSGTGGRDVIYSFDETAQTILGLGGNDLICAGPGDTAYGGGGRDQILGALSVALYGESGNDTVVGGTVGIVSGGSGNDRVVGTRSGELRGDSGNDLLEASDFVDLCDGGSGDDTINLAAGSCTKVVSVP